MLGAAAHTRAPRRQIPRILNPTEETRMSESCHMRLSSPADLRSCREKRNAAGKNKIVRALKTAYASSRRRTWNNPITNVSRASSPRPTPMANIKRSRVLTLIGHTNHLSVLLPRPALITKSQASMSHATPVCALVMFKIMKEITPSRVVKISNLPCHNQQKRPVPIRTTP